MRVGQSLVLSVWGVWSKLPGSMPSWHPRAPAVVVVFAPSPPLPISLSPSLPLSLSQRVSAGARCLTKAAWWQEILRRLTEAAKDAPGVAAQQDALRKMVSSFSSSSSSSSSSCSALASSSRVLLLLRLGPQDRDVILPNISDDGTNLTHITGLDPHDDGQT